MEEKYNEMMFVVKRTAHHLMCDGWLFDEVKKFLDGFEQRYKSIQISEYFSEFLWKLALFEYLRSLRTRQGKDGVGAESETHDFKTCFQVVSQWEEKVTKFDPKSLKKWLWDQYVHSCGHNVNLSTRQFDAILMINCVSGLFDMIHDVVSDGKKGLAEGCNFCESIVNSYLGKEEFYMDACEAMGDYKEFLQDSFIDLFLGLCKIADQKSAKAV